VKRELGAEVEFIQRSVYGTRRFEVAKRLADLARHYGLRVTVFQATEIDVLNNDLPTCYHGESTAPKTFAEEFRCPKLTR
jgi:hypothetical protein